MISSGSGRHDTGLCRVFHPPDAGGAICPPAAQLATWLEANHLNYGYGNFWSSNMVTVVSHGHVKVRAVDGLTGRLQPWHWFSDEKWYMDSPANFVVFDVSHYTDIPSALNFSPGQEHNFYWFGVNATSAQKTFGPGARMYQVGQYYVMVWNHNITPRPTQ